MLKDRDLSILGSFYHYYKAASINERRSIEKVYYDKHNSEHARIYSWERLEEECAKNHIVIRQKHKHPIQYLYAQYIEYIEARENLQEFFDNSDKTDELQNILEDAARAASDTVQEISYSFGKKDDRANYDLTMAFLSSKKIEEQSSMEQMIANLDAKLESKKLIDMLEEIDIGKHSAEVRDAMITILHHDTNSVFSHEFREIHRQAFRNVTRASYSRGFVFGAIFAGHRMGQSIHRRFTEPMNPSALRIIEMLNRDMPHAKLVLHDGVQEMPQIEGVRLGTSLARLLHERNRLRAFIIGLKEGGVISDIDYSSVLAELRPERKKLHRHFKESVRERFGIVAKNVERLQRIADTLPIYGYVSSGAAVKKLDALGSLVYCVMTNDDNDKLSLTTAYTEAMFKKAGGILLTEMTDKQKELYSGKPITL